MHSDGLSAAGTSSVTRACWRDPALIAAVLYQDFKRGRDDATAVVVRSAASS